ncbi:MAG: molybdopterin-binding protein [Syntrophomonadaceae bacterium]|nr:molybdopterin-binding protein [Syntrophomonadaceae bacterium]
MRKVKVEQAIGQVLCHDITKIVPGEFKGAIFKKGHIVREEDVPELLSMGKEHLYIWEINEGCLHEDTAALRIAKASGGEGLSFSSPSEGKINFHATSRGLLKVQVQTLFKINSVPQVVLSTKHNNRVVEKGEIVAGTRVIPMVIDTASIEQVERICHEAGPVVNVKPFFTRKVAIITTGNEVYRGLIQDKFTPVVVKKLESFDAIIIGQKIVPDDPEAIASSVEYFSAKGAEIILVTGGMSVDPDDVTPAGVKLAGARIVSYGAPVLPGSMFMMAYLGDVVVMGLPGCVMYARTTIFDLLLPRVFAGEEICQKDLIALGHGGLCQECAHCHYPACAFGKGF